MLKGLTLNGMYRMGLVKQVQRGTINVGIAAATATLTINEVVMHNTIVHILGVLTDATNGANLNSSAHVQASLTSTTAVTAALNAIDGAFNTQVSVEVIEFYPGVLRVQRGTVTNAGGASSGSTTVTAVVTGKTFLNALGYYCTGAVAHNAVQVNAYVGHLTLSAPTTVVLTVDATGPQEMVHGFELVEILMHGLEG